MTFLLRLLGLDGVTKVEAVEQWVWQAAATPPSWLPIAVAVVGVVIAAVNFLPRLTAELPFL